MFALAGIDQRWVFAAFIPIGIVSGLQNPVLAGYMNRRIPSARRATMLSVQSVVASLIMAITEPAGGALADTVGLRGMFLAFAVGTAVLCGIAFTLWSRAEDAEAATSAIEPDASGEQDARLDEELTPPGAQRVGV
jgi:MFS family permease